MRLKLNEMKNNILGNNTSKLIPIRSILGYSVLAIVSGLSGFAFIAIINKIISDSMGNIQGENTTNYLYMFLVTITIFFITRRWLSGGVIKLSQEIYWTIRKDVIKLILKSPYRKLQEFKDEIYSTLTTDVNNITNASLMVITFFSSLILIIACLVYMAFLSLSLFLISLGTILVGVLIYVIRSKTSNKQIIAVRELENSFVNVFNSILHGAKEININEDKGTQIYDEQVMTIAKEGEITYIKAFIKYLNSELISQLLFYGLITFILVYAESILNTALDVKVSFVFVLLYLMGPIVNVMTIVPIMNRAVVSLKKMQTLKKELQNLEHIKSLSTEDKEIFKGFRNLKLTDYTFSYGKDQFSIGPINLSVNRNEAVFVYGGNGEGKTTFINTVLKLYELDGGVAYVDDELIPEKDLGKVKALFAPVFSDFYLFDDFYGIETVDYDKIHKYLELFELEDKVLVKDGKFSTTDLSTGQRKRLALISILLEDRPILVLDEWAADQDPHFRHKFYTEIIPILIKEEDKTIIAITHDDRYYHVADKLLKMEYGILEEVTTKELVTLF